MFVLELALVLVDEGTHNCVAQLEPRRHADSSDEEDKDSADIADIVADIREIRMGDIPIVWSSAPSRCVPCRSRSWKVDDDLVSVDEKDHGHGIWADDDSLVHIRRALETRPTGWAVWAGNRFRPNLSTGWRAS